MSPEVLQPDRGPSQDRRPWEGKPKARRAPGRSRTPIVVAVVLVLALLGAGLTLLFTQSSTTVVNKPPTATTAPSTGGGGTVPGGLPMASETGPATVPAASPALLSSTPPPGAVTIGTGDDAARLVKAQPPGTSFVLAPGVHEGFSIVPKTGDRFYAGAGAVLDGQGTEPFAFSSITHQGGMADDVAVIGASASSPLVIRNYTDQHQEQQGTIQTNSGSQAKGNKAFASGWDLQYVEITGSYSRAVTLSDDMTVAYCRIVDNGRLGIGGGGQGITIVHDVINGNGVGVANRGSEAGGIKTTGHTVLIAHNQIQGNGAPGVWTDVNAEAVRIVDNTISRNQIGVHVEISHDVLVSGNRIANNKKKAVQISASYQVTVSGNLIVNNEGGVLAGGVNRGHKSGPHPLTNVVVEGNVIINSRASGVTQQLPASDTVTFDYNTFAGGGFVWNGHRVTFNQWQAEGQERHGKFLG